MKDLPAVIKILHRVVPMMNKLGNYQWDKHYPSEDVLRYDFNQRHLYVAVEGSKVIGAVVINAIFPPEYAQVEWKSSPNSFTFHRLMVDPSYSRKGVAKALFKYIEQRGMWMGLRSIRVDTCDANLAMLKLFKLFKYKEVGIVHFRGQSLDFLCFEKTI